MIVDLLRKISNSDAETENNRKGLAYNLEFTVEKGFNRLDKSSYSNITYIELSNYFASHYKAISNEEAKLLERIVNQHCEGRIYFKNFQDYILPQTDEELRSRLATRVSYTSLDGATDRELFNLLSNELSNSLEVVYSFQDLRMRYDYDIYEVFKLIDEVNYGYIDLVNLGRFLRKNNKYLSDRELEGILYRLGHHHTGRVTFSEFAHALTSVYGAYLYGSSLLQAKPDLSYISPAKEKLNASFNGDLYNDEIYRSAKRLESAQREYEETLNRSFRGTATPKSYNARVYTPTPARNVARSMSFVESGYKSAQKTYAKLAYVESYTYAQILANMIQKDSSLEEQKVRLACCSDFNLYDAFNCFQRVNKSYVDVAELQSGLDRLGVYKSYSDVELIVRRFSKGNSSLSFTQFSEMLLSSDRYHADKVRYRQSNPGGYLSVYTASCMSSLLTSMVEGELEYVKAKDNLRYKGGWSNSQAWGSLNPLGLPKVTAEDFRHFLAEHRVVATADELDRLAKRFGSYDIYYPEFVEEIESRYR